LLILVSVGHGQVNKEFGRRVDGEFFIP
jgi:hypothetical protein